MAEAAIADEHMPQASLTAQLDAFVSPCAWQQPQARWARVVGQWSTLSTWATKARALPHFLLSSSSEQARVARRKMLMQALFRQSLV